MPEKILIIDDDLDTLRLVGLMLQKKGYEIIAANNGKQGLQKVSEQIPDLILLDVMMPDMDGYEVARRLRANPKTARVPILMFTAKSQLDDKVTGFEAGVDDYLTKPTHPTELHAHVKALLSRAVKTEKADVALTQQNAFTIGVISARGGLGVSSIALNLGSYLKSKTKKDTVVLETRSGEGTLGRDLGFPNAAFLTNLLNSAANSIDKDAVLSALQEHSSGLKLLFASETPKDGMLNSEAITQMQNIYAFLHQNTQFLVLDLGAGVTAITQGLLAKCDVIVVVTEAYVNSLAQTNLLIKDLFELGFDHERLFVVLNNRIRSELFLPISQVQLQFNYPITVAFTPAPELFFQAIKKNTTAILTDPESLTAKHFEKLATVISNYKAKSK